MPYLSDGSFVVFEPQEWAEYLRNIATDNREKEPNPNRVNQ